MGRLITKLKAAKNKAEQGDASARVYASMEREMRDRLASEARAAVQNELIAAKRATEEAKAETTRIKADLKAQIRTMESIHQQADRDAASAIQTMRGEIEKLSTELTEVKSADDSRKMEADVLSTTLKGQIKEYEQNMEALVKERTNLMEAQQAAQQSVENYTLERIQLVETHGKKTESLLTDLSAAKKEIIEAQARPEPQQPPPSIMQVPVEIPDFTVSEVMRGPNDRIVSATIKPVRAN